jgi:hypothetical protein
LLLLLLISTGNCAFALLGPTGTPLPVFAIKYNIQHWKIIQKIGLRKLFWINILQQTTTERLSLADSPAGRIDNTCYPRCVVAVPIISYSIGTIVFLFRNKQILLKKTSQFTLSNTINPLFILTKPRYSSFHSLSIFLCSSLWRRFRDKIVLSSIHFRCSVLAYSYWLGSVLAVEELGLVFQVPVELACCLSPIDLCLLCVVWFYYPTRLLDLSQVRVKKKERQELVPLKPE